MSLALAQVGHANPVTIRLNSGGGDAAEGAAIHAAIARHAGQTTLVVEGIAASAASLVAMAGDEIVMAPGSIMMIHDPATFTFGTAADHQVTVNYLTAQAVSYAGVYAAQSGKAAEAARADMIAETWLDPEAAVAAGYADRVGEAPAEPGTAEIIDFPLREPSAFAYAQYRNAPEPLRALAATKGWGPPRRSQAASAVVPNRQTETPMTTQPTGGANPAPAPQPQGSATATTPAPADNVVDITTARSTARTEALAYAREVGELCQLAGCPDRATAFIAEDTPIEQVRTALVDAKAQAAANPVNPTQPPAGAKRFDLARAMRKRFGQKEV